MKIAFFGDTNYVGARDWLSFLGSRPSVDVHAIVFPGDRQEIPGVIFHRLPGWIPAGRTRYLACVPSLRGILKRLRPDLLLAYRVVSYGFAAGMTGFRPLVLAAQGQYIVSRETPAFFRHFAIRAIRSAAMVHSWAPPMTESLLGLGAHEDRILTLTRGVDGDRFSFSEEPKGPLTMLTTRQLEPYYDFPTLLRAVERVREEIPRIRYLIAGDGSARASLEEEARERGLGEIVRFLGPVPREELPGLLRSAHLYLSAVPSDGTSMSLLEAMASGAVPIVSDNQSNRFWITDGEGGRLVRAGDSDGFASAIAECWRRESWRKEIRARNRAVVEERASWGRNMERFLEAYREMLREKNEAPAAGERR